MDDGFKQHNTYNKNQKEDEEQVACVPSLLLLFVLRNMEHWSHLLNKVNKV